MAKKAKQARGKRGRPPLPPGEGKLFPLNMRTTKEIRDRLAAAAQESGRSRSQEVEYRLSRSFQDEEARYQTFEDKATFRLMKLLAAAKGLAESRTGKSMDGDVETFRAVKVAINSILDWFEPEPSGDLANKLASGDRSLASMEVARSVVSQQIGEAAAEVLWQRLEEGLSKSETSKRRRKG